MSKKRKHGLSMYQDDGMNMQQSTGMMRHPHQGLVQFQPQDSEGLFSSIVENINLLGRVNIAEKKHAITQHTAEAFSLSLRMAKERALAPYEMAHARAIMKHDRDDREEFRKLAKSNRRKVEAETEQIRVATIGTGLDNRLKEVKVEIAITELEHSKLELEHKKRHKGEE